VSCLRRRPGVDVVRANLLTERIRSGELARFDVEFPQVWKLATDVLHSPELQEQLSATLPGRRGHR
jgi:hypothetical protein